MPRPERQVVKPLVGESGLTCPAFAGLAVVFSQHMHVCRRERKVKLSEIRQTIQSPDATYPCREPDHVRFVKKFKSDHVHLIGVKCESKKFLLVKTVMVLPTRERMVEEE